MFYNINLILIIIIIITICGESTFLNTFVNVIFSMSYYQTSLSNLISLLVFLSNTVCYPLGINPSTFSSISYHLKMYSAQLYFCSYVYIWSLPILISLLTSFYFVELSSVLIFTLILNLSYFSFKQFHKFPCFLHLRIVKLCFAFKT